MLVCPSWENMQWMMNLPEPEQPELRTRFESRVRQELEDLSSLSRLSKPDRAPVHLDQQSIGRVSRIDSLQVQAMSNAAEGRRRQRIKLLEAAIDRIEAGEFGYCIQCGDFIGVKRLETDPAVFRCLDCAR